MAYQVGQRTLCAYAHRFSPKKFTQPQLFAALVLKEFLQFDYRKLSQFFLDAPEFRAAIKLHEVPHFTTFQKAAGRLLVYPRARRLLHETIRIAVKRRRIRRRVALAALDGTGLESHHASTYYVPPPRCWRKNMAKNLLHPFPQGGRSLRLSESLDPRAGSRPRPAARHASLSRGLGSSSGHNSDQCDGGRRRIRQRRVARLRSSTARGAHAHSPVGRSPDGKASLGLLAAKNGGVFES